MIRTFRRDRNVPVYVDSSRRSNGSNAQIGDSRRRLGELVKSALRDVPGRLKNECFGSLSGRCAFTPKDVQRTTSGLSLRIPRIREEPRQRDVQGRIEGVTLESAIGVELP